MIDHYRDLVNAFMDGRITCEEFKDKLTPDVIRNHYAMETRMGHMKTWWIFGFERWGGLRPASMTTAAGVRYVPLVAGVWIRR